MKFEAKVEVIPIAKRIGVDIRHQKGDSSIMKVISYLIEAHIIRKVNDDIEFLLLKRSENEKYPGVWQMVTGSVDENEKAYATALREIKEETGLELTNFWVVPNVNSFYSPERDSVVMVPVFAGLANQDIVKISDEHSDYKWVKRNEAKKLLAWPGQRKSVDIIYEYILNEKSFLKFVELEV